MSVPPAIHTERQLPLVIRPFLALWLTAVTTLADEAVFLPGGTADWNVNSKWSGHVYPNAAGARAVIGPPGGMVNGMGVLCTTVVKSN